MREESGHPTLPAGMPFVEYDDGIQRKGRGIGGSPRPLIPLAKDSK